MFTINASEDSCFNIYQQAQNLYSEGRFDETIIACERYLFFSEIKTLKVEILLLESKAFQQKGNYENASKILLSVPRPLLTSHQRAKIDFELALNSYLSGLYDETEVYLDNCDTSLLSNLDKTNFEILKIFNLCQMGRWDSAQNVILKSKILPNEQKDVALKIFTTKPKMLNGTRLEWFSRFVPGIGQMMAGYFIDGFSSFLFCSTSLAAGIVLVLNGYYISGYFLGAGLLYGFYYGGLRRLNDIVQFENQKRKNTFISKLKNVF